jgi:hypothetical protein
MSKYVVATTIPMMGEHEDMSTKASHIMTTTLAARATRIASLDKESNNIYNP